jgi:hypothetical protein
MREMGSTGPSCTAQNCGATTLAAPARWPAWFDLPSGPGSGQRDDAAVHTAGLNSHPSVNVWSIIFPTTHRSDS